MRARVIVVSVVVAVLALVHSAGAQTPSSFAPAGWDAEFTLHELPDRNPEPRVLEIDLTARVADVDIAPKLRVTAWTYDGRLPGPLIRAKVGDRLIVHFTNQLPEPSTVHWHGVRVPIEMDGVPGISQPGQTWGDVHLRLRPARRRSLLVPPPPHVGGPGGLRPLRRPAGRRSRRQRRRGRSVDDGAQRHQLRPEGHPGGGRQRRCGRRRVRARR